MTYLLLGLIYGAVLSMGVILGVDEAFHSPHALGPVAPFLITLGLTGLGALIGSGARR